MINFKTLTWKVNFYIFFSLVIAELLKCLIVFELVLILPIPWHQWKQFRIFFVQLAEVFFSRFIASVIHSFIQNSFKIVHFCVFIGFYQYVVFFFSKFYGKVELWILLVSLEKKHHKTTFPVKISV